MDEISKERAQRSALRLEQLVVMGAPREILLNEIRVLKGILGLDPDENDGARE